MYLDTLGLVADAYMATRRVRTDAYMAGVLYQLTSPDNGAAHLVATRAERVVFMDAMCDTGSNLADAALDGSKRN